LTVDKQISRECRAKAYDKNFTVNNKSDGDPMTGKHSTIHKIRFNMQTAKNNTNAQTMRGDMPYRHDKAFYHKTRAITSLNFGVV
jgi:hypothetical protein